MTQLLVTSRPSSRLENSTRAWHEAEQALSDGERKIARLRIEARWALMGMLEAIEDHAAELRAQRGRSFDAVASNRTKS